MKRIDMTHLAVAAALAMPAAAVAKDSPLAGLLDGIKAFATYNYKGGVSAGRAAGIPATPNLFGVVDIELDFAAIAAARVAAGQAALGAADVLELIPVRAGTLVLLAGVQTTKVEGAACTFDLGDGADPNGFVDNHDANALGWSASLATVAYSIAVGGGRLYTADDTIDLIVDSAATDVNVTRVFALMVDMRQYRS